MSASAPPGILEVLGENPLAGCVIPATIPGDPEPPVDDTGRDGAHTPACGLAQAMWTSRQEGVVAENDQWEATLVCGKVVRDAHHGHGIGPIAVDGQPIPWTRIDATIFGVPVFGAWRKRCSRWI